MPCPPPPSPAAIATDVAQVKRWPQKRLPSLRTFVTLMVPLPCLRAQEQSRCRLLRLQGKEPHRCTLVSTLAGYRVRGERGVCSVRNECLGKRYGPPASNKRESKSACERLQAAVVKNRNMKRSTRRHNPVQRNQRRTKERNGTIGEHCNAGIVSPRKSKANKAGGLAVSSTAPSVYGNQRRTKQRAVANGMGKLNW